jgi:parallel beta-helix repeat protein
MTMKKTAQLYLNLFFLLSLGLTVKAQTNLALTATSTHSGGGASASGYGPELYNDGVIPPFNTTGTFLWGWVTSNGWIEYTWTAPVTINRVVFYKDNRMFTNMNIEIWNGSAYVVVQANYTGTSAQVDSITFANPLQTTRIRFNNIAGSNPNFREIQAIQLSTGFNNASARGLVSPINFSPGVYNVNVRVANSGRNAITSLVVNWELNDTLQTPVNFFGILDTLGGSLGPNDTVITLGSVFFPAGQLQRFKVWTSLPNNTADTINSDDTIRFNLRPSMEGLFTIGKTTSDYPSLGAAATDLALFGVSGPVTLRIDSNISGQVTFASIPGINATNKVTIKGNKHLLTANAAPVITFNNVSNIDLDSLDITLTAATGFVVHLTNQTRHLSITNCVINAGTTSTLTTNAGIVASGSATGATTAGNNARNITISNNTIIGGYYGISFVGNSSYLNCTGNNFTNNTIRDFHLYGIYLANTDTTVIANNTMTRLVRPSFTTFYGIYGTTTRNTKVLNNSISNSGPGSYSAYPIWFATSVNSPGFETEIINNAIFNITTTGLYYGIYTSGSTTGFKIYHNTVYDNTTSTTGTRRNIFFSVAPNSVDLRNNIFVMEGSGTGAKHNIYVTTTSTSFTANRNVYFMGATAGTNNLGFWGTNNASLADWQTASSQDSNSVNTNPVFANIAAGNFTPISVNIDNLGSNVGVTTDIFGNTRSTTTPDVGAAEFTGISVDVSVVSGRLTRSSVCYSLFDTVRVTVQNLIGPTINFTNDPLTVVYQVNGPVTTIDSFVVNSGTLAANAQLTLTNNNVNMSQPGNYSLTAYVRPNAVNNIALNDTIRNVSAVEVRPIISVTPKTGIANSPTDTFVLTAQSPLFPSGGAIITEICHFKTTVGAPTGGWPAYLLADDYIEITGVPNSDLAGFTLEEWSATALVHSVTFPTGTLFGPNGTMIVATGQLGSSVPSPANFYYHSGNTATKGSTSAMGYLIKNPNGDIVDAVVYGTLTFPAASGVTTAHWSGNTPALSSSGNRLAGPDMNDSTNWVNSGTSPQDPNVLNSGVPLPQPGSMAGFNWYFLSNPIDTNARIKVGPYNTPGTYQYVAVYNTVCGLFSDTVTITATQNVPVKLNALTARKFNNDVVLNWSTASETNNSHFAVERSLDGTNFEAIGTVKGNGTTARLSNYHFTDYMAADEYSRYNTLYYRLKQYDFDGSYDYSQTVTVNVGSTEKVQANIYPNPNKGSFELLLSAVNGSQVTVDIYDMIGNLVYSQQFSGNALQQMLVQHNLNSGMYTANVKHNGTATVIKFVVQ